MAPIKGSRGPLIGVLAMSAAAVPPFLVKFIGQMDGSVDTFVDAVLWLLAVSAGVFALLAVLVSVLKRRARRVAAVIGSRAFLALPDATGGVGHLRSRQGYGVAAYPVVSVRSGRFEIWGHDFSLGPDVSILLEMTSITLGRQWAPWPQSALVVSIRGLSDPLYFSIYGDRWWSVFPAREVELLEIAAEIGLSVVERDRSGMTLPDKTEPDDVGD